MGWDPRPLDCKSVELRAAGIPYSKIAEELQTSKQTLITWSQSLHRQIHNLKAIEFEAICQKYLVAREARVRIFGEILEKAVEEFRKRDLSLLSTEKLLDVLFKYGSALDEIEVSPSFRGEDTMSFIPDREWTG